MIGYIEGIVMIERMVPTCTKCAANLVQVDTLIIFIVPLSVTHRDKIGRVLTLFPIPPTTYCRITRNWPGPKARAFGTFILILFCMFPENFAAFSLSGEKS